MNGLEIYIDLLEKSDLVIGETTKNHIKYGELLKASLSEERRQTTISIIKDLKKIII